MTIGSTLTASALEQGNIGHQATGRPVVYGTQGVISSGHYLTSMAGMRMLLSGGNAFDAVVAAGFAAAVTEPIASYSLAAEGVFMLYHAESGDLLSLSGQGTAPRLATADWYRSQGQDEIPTGPGPLAHLSFTVPGVVAAYLSLLERYGSKTVGEALEPAIHYAERGIPNYEYMLERIDGPGTRSQWDEYPPGGSEVFYDDGNVPEPGSLLVQKSLGLILRKLVEAESAAPGHRLDGVRAARDCFYTGEVAQIIHDCAHRVGGILGLKSLASYEAKYETPLKTSYMGHEVHGQRTWTQGAVLMQALNILENFDLRGMGHNSTAYVHTVSQAVNLAFADREAYYGDPDFVEVPVDGLLSKDYAKERAALIDSNRAVSELPPPGDPFRYSEMSGVAAQPSEQAPTAAADGGGADSGTTPHFVHRPRWQHGVRHAFGWILRQVRVLPRTWLRSQHANRNVQLGGRTSEPAGAIQASQDDAGELHGHQGRPANHDYRLSRWRPSGAGKHAAGPEYGPVGHESSGGGRSSQVRKPGRAQQLLSAHLLPRPAWRRSRYFAGSRWRAEEHGTRHRQCRKRRNGSYGEHSRSADRRTGVFSGPSSRLLRSFVVKQLNSRKTT